MTSLKLYSATEDARATCGDCGWKGDADDCEIISDAHERLDVGGVVPAGECPDCGALAYLDEPARHYLVDAMSATDLDDALALLMARLGIASGDVAAVALSGMGDTQEKWQMGGMAARRNILLAWLSSELLHAVPYGDVSFASEATAKAEGRANG